MGYTIEQIKEVERSLSAEKNVRVYRRLQVLLWHMRGKSEKEVAEITGVSVWQVFAVKRKYKYGGISALKVKYVGGNSRKLSLAEEKEELGKLVEQAKNGVYLRGAELQKTFENATGTSYHSSAFYRLLERHGWGKKVPRGQHPKKASAEDLESSKKLT
jgi:transposase